MLLLFDTKSEVLHDRVPISEVKPMKRGDFRVGGCTALIDAIGGAVHHIGNIHKYARKEDIPEHTVFVITTDGKENASQRYLAEEVKRMIKRQTDRYGWEFLFVAANIDAVETAGKIGIRRERAANYKQTPDGYEKCYAAMSEFVAMARCESTSIDSAWKRKLEEKRDA